MSHEIRTPLNAIIGMIAVAEQADDPEKTAYSMKQIKSASEHLLGVVNDILDISKIEEGKLTLAPVQFDVKGVVSRIAAVFGARAREKGLSVTIDIADGVPACLVGDDQKLAQVIGNLIGNAIKFTPEGGEIRLSCTVDAEDEHTCALRFAVRDSGIGITEDQKDRLFEAFQQAESDTTRKYGGTGLGLAISKRIVELMDGHIWVESEYGTGSTFTFVVMLQKATDECAAGSGSGALPGEAGAGDALDADAEDNDFTGHRLLIVEDVEINREILLTLLEPTGIEMECAENGQQALEMVKADPGRYDIVFMDIQMPVMDGYEATRRIRALDDARARELPIIAISANTFREDVEKSIEAGMNAHIGKPIDMHEAIRNIRDHLKPVPDYII
jgi:CheY-like chemotaxis protein/two-component sensor histidine kinase